MKNNFFLAGLSLLIAFSLLLTPASASPSVDDLIDAGYIALDSGNNQMAEDLFTRALGYRSGQNSPLAWTGLGRALWDESSSSNEESYTAFNRSLSIEDVSSKDWRSVFDVFFDEPVEDFELSYSAAQKAVEADPKDDVAWNYLGVSFDRLYRNNTDMDLNVPFEAFKKASALNPTPLYSLNAGFYAILIGNYTYAVDVTDRAVKYYSPDNWGKGELLLFKAFALAEMGNSEEALENIEMSRQALNSDELFEWDEISLMYDGMVSAIALNNLERFDESVEILKRVDTDKLDDYCNDLLLTPEKYMDVYGVALSGAGQKDEAVTAFEKALEYNSDYEPAKEHLKNLNIN